MKIGIIVLSLTGHTLEVAEALSQQLDGQGHEVVIDRIGTRPAERSDRPPVLTDRPDPTPYDAVVFASLVQAFHLSETMKRYLQDIPRLDGRPVAVFVTQHLKWKLLGGACAVRTMRRMAEAAGGRVLADGIVHWSHPKREEQKQQVAEQLAAALSGTAAPEVSVRGFS